MKNTLIRFESQGYNVQLQAYEKKLEPPDSNRDFFILNLF